jgi:site-specific DNA-methyltransferase (adenine-specific)
MVEPNQIYCCDYLELLRQIPDNSVSLVLSDPPFGINYSNNYTKKKHEVLQGDASKFSYLEFGKEAFRILKDDTAIFVFTGWSEYPDHYKQLESCGFSMKEPIICQKRASGKTDLYGSFQTNSDWIIFAHKGRFKFRKTTLVKNKKAGVIPNIGRSPVPEYKTRFPSCWFGEEYPWSSENSAWQKVNGIYHPTIKGQMFLMWLILLSTEPGDLVVDPFVGSGTTAVAAKMAARQFFASDVSPEFCEQARKRLTLCDFVV